MLQAYIPPIRRLGGMFVYTELHIRKRVFALLVLMVFVFSLLSLRIIYLTTSRSEELTLRGVRQWTRSGTVYARRGSIQDTNGQTLVMSATAYIVSADPRKISDISLFTQTICPILDLLEETVQQKLQDRSKASVTLKRQVSRETADRLRALQAQEDAAAVQLKALLFDEDVRRVYPRGAFLSQTLGLTNVDSAGQSGLEQQYDTLLKGTAGASFRSVDGHSQPIYDSGNLYIEPQDGNTVRLTIDAGIQEICEKAMRECYAVNKAQAVHVIAMDPYTGAILAMCSKPDYDPNDPPREQPDALAQLMRIRLISDAYEPGSTFKILTAAAALDAGVTTPEDTFYCSAKSRWTATQSAAGAILIRRKPWPKHCRTAVTRYSLNWRFVWERNVFTNTSMPLAWEAKPRLTYRGREVVY